MVSPFLPGAKYHTNNFDEPLFVPFQYDDMWVENHETDTPILRFRRTHGFRPRFSPYNSFQAGWCDDRDEFDLYSIPSSPEWVD